MKNKTRGLTLVELIVAIVVISLGLAGVMIVIVRNTQASADPMILHQSIAIAEAYLEEIVAKNFTDPDGLGGETRATFDNVADYNGLNDNGARDQSDTPIAGLGAYRVQVQVTNNGLNGIGAANSLLIQVTVTPPHGGAITVSGYRTNYF